MPRGKPRLLPLLLSALIVAGCGSRPKPAPESTAEPVPSVSPAPATAEPSPTPRPTVAVPTPTPEPRWVRGEERTGYAILCGAAPGAEALTVWLLGEGRETMARFGPEYLEEAMFEPMPGADRSQEDIPTARAESRYVTLAADRRLVESGLLEALLSVFELRYGYRVEVLAGDDPAALCAEAELAILGEAEAAAVRRTGSFVTYWPFAETFYIREE